MAVIEELLENLKEAMEFMDIDKADELMKELRSYSFSEEVTGKIESLGAAVVNLDVEAVTDIIDETKDILQIN